MIPIFLNNLHVFLGMMLSSLLLNLNKTSSSQGSHQKTGRNCQIFFVEEQDPEISQTSPPYFTTEGLKLRSLETPITKHRVKQGPVKSNKMLKYNPKEDDE